MVAVQGVGMAWRDRLNDPPPRISTTETQCSLQNSWICTAIILKKLISTVCPFVNFADPDLGGTPPQDTSATGICRSNSTMEWELLHYWNTYAGLGMTSWDIGEMHPQLAGWQVSGSLFCAQHSLT